MTIKHLRVLATVARLGSISQAAGQLYLSQPTVSQIVAQLEDYCGARLFDRLSHRLYPTAACRELVGQAVPLLEAFDRLDQSMRDTLRAQPVRLGTSVTVGTCLLASLSQRFHDLEPESRMDGVVNNTHIIEELLLRGELDLAFVEGRVKSPHLTVEPILEDHLILACSPSHPFASQKEVTLAELSRQTLLLREEGSGTRELFENDLCQHRLTLDKTWSCSNSEAIKNALLGNLGVSVISALLVERELLEGSLRAVKVVDRPGGSPCLWRRPFSLVIHRDKYQTPAILAMMEAIRSFRGEDLSRLLP